MLKLRATAQYKKDRKLMLKRKLSLEPLDYVIQALIDGKPLEAKYRDHALSGNYKGFRECHISPDWLLIYAIDGDNLILTTVRTGTHSDLF
ncbi:MAG: type II toxin-antitoxin system YafQ family toxin [Deferribacteraceae bacterium]|jgi:mRNA interferase YafQ|nr:type II toxin-antitoxin system YafQ family toxin [Deferribacteraceae bacterium]